MSLKQIFAQALGFARIPSPFSLKEELMDAIYDGTSRDVKKIVTLSPHLASGKKGKMDTAPLEYALYRGNDVAAEILVDAARELLTARDAGGLTLIMRYARNPSSRRAFKMLLGFYTADELARTDGRGNTVLHFAAQERGARLGLESWEVSTIALDNLLPLKLHVNARNNEGETPLMMAAQHGYGLRGIDALLANGAELNAVDNSGFSATTHAILSDNVEAAMHLMAKGGVVNADIVEKHICIPSHQPYGGYLDAVRQCARNCSSRTRELR